MKLTKLSLITTLVMSSTFSGEDIVPIKSEVAPVEESATTIAGKASLIYITNDNELNAEMFDNSASAAAAAITLDVSHKFLDYFTANFTAIGYTTLGSYIGNGQQDWAGRYIGAEQTGAYINVANLTATYADTTLVAGRQLLNTPMLQGYDWLLAPTGFEAYTIVNNAIENLTLVGYYVDKIRPTNGGSEFLSLGGDNWTVGATYSNGIKTNIWYYHIDANLLTASPPDGTTNYTQVYADIGYTFSGIKLEGQYVQSAFETGLGVDSNAFGAKVSATFANVNVNVAYNRLNDGKTPDVSWNALYVNAWNQTVARQYDSKNLDAFMIAADAKIANIELSTSYANFDKGHEFDFILSYEFAEAFDVLVVYSNNKRNLVLAPEINVLELYANYKF